MKFGSRKNLNHIGINIVSRLVYFETVARKILFLLKGKLLKIFLLPHGCKVGKGLKCRTWPIFRSLPKGNIVLGDYVTIGYNITFDLGENGNIILGDHVHLTQNILISSNKEVTIGSYTLIGENVSIRDGEHKTDRTLQIALQDTMSQRIAIGEDVWIGAGCMVLKGSTLNDGSVIGANSVVTRNNLIKHYHIYAGSPVRLIGKRS